MNTASSKTPDPSSQAPADTPSPAPFSTSFLHRARRLFSKRTTRDVSEDEIKSLVDDADNLIDDKKRMIGEILDLDELAVNDVMTPRVDMIGISDDETVRSALERMLGTGYSRMPVFHEDLDTIVGLIHLKDLVQPALDGQESQLAVQFCHDAFFIPETKDLFSLLREMQEKRQQMAVVVDEYGGTDGLITVEDIVEEIVGEIIDESDSQHAFLIDQGKGEWIADGRLTVEDAREAGFPIEESPQYDTIAGWFMSVIDAVPQIGREIQHEGFCFRVQDMRRRRIRLLHISCVLPGNLQEKRDEHRSALHAGNGSENAAENSLGNVAARGAAPEASDAAIDVAPDASDAAKNASEGALGNAAKNAADNSAASTPVSADHFASKAASAPVHDAPAHAPGASSVVSPAPSRTTKPAPETATPTDTP